MAPSATVTSRQEVTSALPSTAESIESTFKDTSASWKTRAIRKREEREAAINSWLNIPANKLGNHSTYVKNVPLECGLLSTEQVEVTESVPSRLQRKLLDGSWSAEAVARAFITRTVIAHHLTNPVTEVLFDRAIQRAQELDATYQRTGKPVGPLHGFPISLKDAVYVAGVTSSLGFVSRLDTVRPSNDILVEKLLDAGAVFYVKTNVPQSLMSGECFNFVFGRTSTPLNTTLSAGGSSGGEGSLIALGGSPLGIGSDIAGSIRTPANFNGVFGLCPSPERFPYHAAKDGGGDTIIRPVAGPLSRSVDGLELYTRTLLALKPWEWDQSSVPLPWREPEYVLGCGKVRPLCFGLMTHDAVVLPHPPILRGLDMLKTALEDAGHQVVEIEPFDGKEILDLSFKIWSAEGGSKLRAELESSGEPLIKEAIPPNESLKLSVEEYQAAAVQVNVLRQKYLDRWSATRLQTRSGEPVDAIILPSGGHVAPPHGTMEYFTYEAISNLLEWTCATIPVTSVDADVDKVDNSPFKPMSDADQRNWDKCEYTLRIVNNLHYSQLCR